MARRSGIYIVPTNRWYIERTVWLIAGVVLIVATTLAAFVQKYFALLIIATGAASVTVALTGFCVVGNILRLFGVKPMLPQPLRKDDGKRRIFYFMQTDRWYLERYIYIFVGVNLSLSSMLARFSSQGWLFFTGFVGTATIVFSFTGFCIMANLLYRLGAEPRLCRYI